MNINRTVEDLTCWLNTNSDLISRLFYSVSLSHRIQCIPFLLQLINTHTSEAVINVSGL